MAEPRRRRPESFAEGSRVRALARRKRRHRRQLLVIAAVLVIGAALVTADLVHLSPGFSGPRAGASPARLAPAPGRPPPSVPDAGPGTYAYADGSDQVIGAGAGAVKKYRVAVEDGIGSAPGDFAERVRQVLADPKGWTAGGDVRFQPVAQSAPADFTIFLATGASSEKLCAAGGIHTDRLTSCRLPGQVILNLALWLAAIPGYGAPLAEYQAYELNHQVGRELGHANEACPGPGQTAPVMQQQALGLKGCTPNGWPYPNGHLYSGPPVP